MKAPRSSRDQPEAGRRLDEGCKALWPVISEQLLGAGARQESLKMSNVSKGRFES
jgi:hypothetical protein